MIGGATSASETLVVPAPAPRIRGIEISDFRAFPAIQPGRFDLGEHGCNLLAFGENGAGKSSLYRALRGLFSTEQPDAIAFRNVFTDPPQPSVKVTMTNGTVHAWTAASHPGLAVLDIARRAAFLSHRRLIEMNTGVTPQTPPNLFDVAVSRLLADYEGTMAGGTRRTIAELWQATLEAAGRRRRGPNSTREVVAACDAFNEGMRQALDALETQAKPLLRRLLNVLSADSMELVGLIFSQARYDPAERALEHPSLVPTVRFRGYTPPAPQSFLNEARQTALAIAIYLAARLACVPRNAATLKLLVMDDLLISLDSSHRRPVLEVITEMFDDWQIILLTHDRYWFELAREQLTKQRWKSVEIYERNDGNGLLVPLIRPVAEDAVAATLEQAKEFLADNHPAAAANYARSACELAMRRFCRNHRVRFPYFEEAKRPDLNDLLTAARNQCGTDVARLAALNGLEAHKRYVLNPLSHDPLTPLPATDVEAAIRAVEELVRSCNRGCR